MKPHEETWTHDVDGTICLDKPPPGFEKRFAWEQDADTIGAFAHIADGAFNADADDNARAQLASAAPDMACVLLAVEWSGGEDGDRCPSCGNVQPESASPHEQPEFIGHAPDCALDAALRKAGVR